MNRIELFYKYIEGINKGRIVCGFISDFSRKMSGFISDFSRKNGKSIPDFS